MAQAQLIITGAVQGVFYRDNAKEKATELSLKGYAKNMPDGSVESVVIGEKEDIEKYAKWCEEGSPSATVESVNLNWTEEDISFEGFETY